ncbi:hypothetical protein [Paenibacillus sp. GYB003]|uniref:hypothetical protein n=1 Tax=Paenibacillus sp. GYB003 TaxID=2994392 RepID=UPI002F968D86
MTPFAAKLIVLAVAAVAFYVMKLMFKGTLKGEAGASNILFVTMTPLIAAGCLFVFFFLFKAVYYMFV